ncbi:hypothetical protein [Streptomyces sp. CB02959]|uniref:hypothetical protein n=1 Tax=Streptomyces sp. CB02959 TaxID=2020330 RepID=UPI0011AF0C0F|nr:hypothetical protein [Streptomyces sp. CB02959]
MSQPPHPPAEAAADLRQDLPDDFLFDPARHSPGARVVLAADSPTDTGDLRTSRAGTPHPWAPRETRLPDRPPTAAHGKADRAAPAAAAGNTR